MAECHPVGFQWVMEAKARGATVIHVDPRFTRTSAVADETLQHPRCVYQLLKKHYARYTPELVEEVCGVPKEAFLRVAESLCANSGRERTSAFVYSVGWTQHTVGVQYIRTAAIIQLLLGNVGRPGGGVLALRGHASIQGSTDIPTLYDILPGYLTMPHVAAYKGLEDYIEANKSPGGWGGTIDTYIVSLLKAGWGEKATPETAYCSACLPGFVAASVTYRRVPGVLDATAGG